MKRYIGALITIFFLVLFLVYFFKNLDSFSFIKNIPPSNTIGIALLDILIIFINGFLYKYILKEFNVLIGHFESFYLAIITFLGNYFIPMRGGAGIRAIYLKKNFKLHYSYFVSILSGNYIITFLILSVIALFSLVMIQIETGVFSITLYVFFSLILIFSIYLIQNKIKTNKLRLKERLSGRHNLIDRFLKILSDISYGFNSIKNSRKLLFLLITLTLLNTLLTLVVSFLEFKVINIDLNLINLFLYTCLSGISLLVSITPGSIGIRESIFIIFSSTIGITNSQVLQVALVDRGILYLTLVLLFVITKLLNYFKRNNYETS